jgi:Domain of unknown function (DUF3786)
MLNIKDLSRPELPIQDNHEQALKLGLEVFNRRDPGRVAQKAAAEFKNRTVIVPHLNKRILFDLDAQNFALEDAEGESEAPIWLAILTLHYLNNAEGMQPTGNLKHFREFKDGQFYEPAFNSRTKQILIQVFGSDPAPMIAAGKKLNGTILKDGDASVGLPYFPCLPITCILWRGDDEFPADASVLFDETADIFFSAEDMAVAGQMAVLELLKAGHS